MLAHTIRLRHTTVERLDQLVQGREHLLAVGLDAGGIRRLIGRSLALPAGCGIDTNTPQADPLSAREIVETSWCRYQRASRFFRPNPPP